MTDPRALAHEIMDKACVGYDCAQDHTDLCDEITIALRTARKEAYERAAKVADGFAEWEPGAPKISAAIRKLGDDDELGAV